MRQTSLWFAAAVAAGFALGFAGCGPSGPGPMTTCTSDAQCATGEACNTVLKSCVTACTASTDCPDSAKTCATMGGLSAGNDAGIRAFCQCGTDALCDRGTPGQVCQPASKICGAKCTANSGCPTGTTCDTMSGKCSAASMDAGTDGGTMDGGTDGGTGGCTPGSCSAPNICVNGACAAPAACSSANPQPDSCAYGLTCSGAACAEAPRTGVGCMNFMNLPTPTLWNPATVTPKGPVSVSFASITKDTGMPLFCGARGADFSAEVNLYAGNTNFPAMLDLLPANFLKYVRTDGQALDIKGGTGQTPLARPTGGYSSGLSDNNKNLRLRFNLCVMGSPASLSAGFYAENGNAVCANLQ